MKALFIAAGLLALSTVAHAAPVSLGFTSDPPGAEARVAYEDKEGIHVLKCETPCALDIPQRARFAFVVDKAGFLMVPPANPPKWVKNVGRFGFRLEPKSVDVVMKPR